MNDLKKILYRVTCDVHRLKINKSMDFETKIMWKRHEKKAETTPTKHQNGYSIFNQALTLQFEMPYNPLTSQYQSKNTQIVAVIVFQGKVKSGGYAKYNISDNLNQNPYQTTRVTIPMTQCPDPASFIEVSFSYERIGQQLDGNQISIMNVSSRDLEMSRIDFKDDRLSLEMDKINDTIHKFERLVVDIKEKGKQNGRKIPELMSKMECFQGEKYALLNTIQKLQKQLKVKENIIQEERKKAKQQAEETQKNLQKKIKQTREGKSKSKQNIPNYKELYENAVRELEEVRNSQGNLRKSLDLRLVGNLEDVQKIADFSKKPPNSDSDDNENLQKLQELSRQNVQLQSHVASMSHKLAQLFNASYEYGGAKLLDYLQTSIGLTELAE